MFVSSHFCLQTIQESTAELGSHSYAHQGCGMCAVCFQRTALCGDKEIPAFWGNSLWPAVVYSSLVPTPPTCSRFALPSSQRSPQHPPAPALTLTHRTAPGWPPDAQQSTGGARSLLAGAARPWHSCCVPAGSLDQAVPAGLALHGDNGSLLCPAQVPRLGGHMCALLACCPGPEAARNSWVTLSTGTLPQGSLLWVRRALASHCWHRNWQPLPSHPCSPWAEEQGLAGFPKCPQLSPRHGETEIQTHVCCNLNLGKCPAIHSVRRKGKAPSSASQAAVPAEKSNTLAAPNTVGRDLFAATFLPHSLCEEGTVSSCASHLQDLNPCLLLQLEGSAMDWSCWLCTRLRSAETAAAGSARSQHSSWRLSTAQAGAAGEAVAAAGTGTRPLGFTAEAG